LLQVAIDRYNFQLPEIPSFTNDIFPILTRANKLKWLSKMMWKMHSRKGKKPASMESKHKIMEHTNPLITDEALRKKVFEKLTDPSDPLAGEDNDMPMLWSDYYLEQTRDNGEPRNFTLCQWQYDYLEKWSRGVFNDDWNPALIQVAKITANGLDKAALENCIGGPFYPGIEASWFIRDQYRFMEPFRLSQILLSAGDVTKQMALPWQADFFDCQQDDALAWWPAQRPDDVFTEGASNMHKWTRQHVKDYQGMVDKWSYLGFVIKKGDGYIETERKP
jgi:hypothetical protein